MLVKSRCGLQIILWLIFSLLAFEVAADENEPPKIGNFALPSSQQPGPLVSLGQNIVDTNMIQFFLAADDVMGKHQHFIDVTPGIVWGVTDKWSVFFNVPFAADYRQGGTQASGLEDIFLQTEYAFHVNNTSRFSEQATILANITFPTGSTEKQPTTGIGAVSFLLGGTYSLTYSDWYGFISPGAIITTSHDETKYGNKYLYQFGIGRNLFFKPFSWILFSLLEIDGQYVEKDKIHGERNNDSGGKVITVTPSLWFSTNKLILQFGVGFPVIQDLFGEQNIKHILLVASFGWTF